MSDPDDSFDDVLAKIDIPQAPAPKKMLIANDTTNVAISLATSSRDQSASKPTDPSTSAPGKPSVNKAYSILVNPKQRGNPLLKSITNLSWEYDDTIIPDYVVGKTVCILFLSLRYHNLNPDYIHNRLKLLGKMYELRVLLVQVDMKESYNALKHLTRICLLADLTLILAWNPEEAGKIVETYKMFENKPPTAIMKRQDKNSHQNLINALTKIKPINKTDALTLLQNFGTLEKLVKADEDELFQCHGLGPRKAKKLYKTLNEKFLK